MPFEFHSYDGKAETEALIDSGATGNFIDYRWVIQHRLGTQTLAEPIPVHNVDGTQNKAGLIRRYTDVMMTRGSKTE